MKYYVMAKSYDSGWTHVRSKGLVEQQTAFLPRPLLGLDGFWSLLSLLYIEQLKL